MIGKESAKRMDGNKFSYEWIETLPRLEGVARILGQLRSRGANLNSLQLVNFLEKNNSFLKIVFRLPAVGRAGRRTIHPNI